MSSSFKPRYPQPFTLEQAFALDVPTISEEISRLENSLEYLRETQVLLQEHIVATGGDTDDDINSALKENESVIGSQEERIEMLKMALRDKGITSTSHYQPSQTEQANNQGNVQGSQLDEDDQGIHL